MTANDKHAAGMASEDATGTTAPAQPAGRTSTTPPAIRRNLWLGLLGSLLLSLGAFGVGDIPRNHSLVADLGLSWITYGHGKAVMGILFWTGVALMVIAWVRLGRQIGGRRIGGRDRTGPGQIPGLRRWVLAWAAPLLVTVPIYSRDVYAYLGQGAALREGFNPYADGPAHYPGPLLDSMAQVWAGTTAPYGPFFMGVARLVTEVTGDHVILGVLAMRLVLLPGLFLTLWAVPRLAAHFGVPPAAGLWLLLFNPMVLIHLVAGPHVELLMVGVMLVGLVWVLRGRHLLGLGALGVAVSIKITAGIAVPFVLWIWLSHIRSRRDVTARDVIGAFAAIVAVVVAVFAACTAALGLGFGWLTGLGWADRIINWFTLPTVAAHAFALIASPFAALNLQSVLEVTRMIGAVALAGILVWLWWRHRHSERDAVAGIAWAMLAVLLLEPSTLPWYYTWALAPAVAFVLPRRIRAIVVGVSVFMLIVFQPDDSILFYKLPEVLLALALAMLAAVSLIRPDPLRLRGAARWAWNGPDAPRQHDGAPASDPQAPEAPESPPSHR